MSVNDECSITVNLTEFEADLIHRHLGYVRCWLDGYSAGARSGPIAGFDILRRIQILVEHARSKASTADADDAGNDQ